MAKRIITESIKDHPINHVSPLKYPNKIMGALTHLFKGKNINKRTILKTHMKNVKLQDLESIHSYFSIVNQIKEQIEAIGDTVDEV
jgi:hypothetical protein